MDAITANLQVDKATSLKELGFEFDPFERLEASRDRYIHEYLIGHEMFAIAWEKSPSTLLAPAGGGKTTMRIYTLRACWLSESQRLKFPVSYDLPMYCKSGGPYSLDAHKTALAAAAATDLLLACAYRPELYLKLVSKRRAFLLGLLQCALPGDLVWNLSILEETGDPVQLSAKLDRSYVLPAPPSAQQARAFSQTLQTDLMSAARVELEPGERFDALIKFLCQDLGFGTVFILLDGVDGMTSMADNPDLQYRVIAPLFQQALSWMSERLFLKAFLPLELEELLHAHAGAFYGKSLNATITWDIPNLAEILRRRVYVASHGKFGSLDALSSPALRDVETLIAQKARCLPREAIVLAGKVLGNLLVRSSDGLGRLDPGDLELAEQQYEAEWH